MNDKQVGLEFIKQLVDFAHPVWIVYSNDKRYLCMGEELRVNVSTRAGRMAARAYALTYLAEEPNELRGEEVYNEIIKLIGESE